MQRERMSKKKSSQVHCISSHDHILMMASTSKHIPEIRLYKAWKGNNVIIYSLPEANNITCFLLFKYDYMINAFVAPEILLWWETNLWS